MYVYMMELMFLTVAMGFLVRPLALITYDQNPAWELAELDRRQVLLLAPGRASSQNTQSS